MIFGVVVTRFFLWSSIVMCFLNCWTLGWPSMTSLTTKHLAQRQTNIPQSNVLVSWGRSHASLAKSCHWLTSMLLSTNLHNLHILCTATCAAGLTKVQAMLSNTAIDFFWGNTTTRNQCSDCRVLHGTRMISCSSRFLSQKAFLWQLCQISPKEKQSHHLCYFWLSQALNKHLSQNLQGSYLQPQ